MKLKELLKLYYNDTKEVTMASSKVVNNSFKELTLPGSFRSMGDYRKTLSWNLDRDVYYREATKLSDPKENSSLYVTMTTGKMDFYFIFDSDNDFEGLLEMGLKKHKGYRKEYLPWDTTRRFLFYSKKYE